MANRPRDPNSLAAAIVAETIGEAEKVEPEQKNEARAKAGRRGGKARAEALSAEKRRAIGRKGSRTRWNQEPRQD